MKLSQKGSLRGVIATAAAVVCAAGGLALVGVAVSSQRVAPVTKDVGAARSPLPATPVDGPAAGVPSARRGRMLPTSKPVTLDIPSIDVHSTVQHLGQTADGALETPPPGPHYDEAAWYRYSPTPGSIGPAILLGHVDSAAGGPSVFFRLGELDAGDLVSVGRADGSIAVFVVDEVRRYAKDDFPTKVVYGDIDHAGLRILTCGGEFDADTGHYLDNIVVFASLRDRLPNLLSTT